MQVTKSSKSKATSNNDKSRDLKPVLSESVKDSGINTTTVDKSIKDLDDKKEFKDENANDSAVESMETDEETSSQISQEKNSDIVTPYDNLFDIVKDDGFVYHMIYEG